MSLCPPSTSLRPLLIAWCFSPVSGLIVYWRPQGCKCQIVSLLLATGGVLCLVLMHWVLFELFDCFCGFLVVEPFYVSVALRFKFCLSNLVTFLYFTTTVIPALVYILYWHGLWQGKFICIAQFSTSSFKVLYINIKCSKTIQKKIQFNKIKWGEKTNMEDKYAKKNTTKL